MADGSGPEAETKLRQLIQEGIDSGVSDRSGLDILNDVKNEFPKNRR